MERAEVLLEKFKEFETKLKTEEGNFEKRIIMHNIVELATENPLELQNFPKDIQEWLNDVITTYFKWSFRGWW